MSTSHDEDRLSAETTDAEEASVVDAEVVDAEEFGEMNCKTCHGPGAEDKSFEMPNPDIMPLDFSKMDQLDEEHKKVADWMHEVVVPKMADLLGEQPYDPATQQGFGCLGCHTMVQK